MAANTTRKAGGRTTAKKTRLASIEDILGAKRAVTEHVDICVDSTLVDARDEASKAVGRAELAARRRDAAPEAEHALDDARAALDSAQAAVDAATARFTFKALGNMAVEALQRQHRPTPAQEVDAMAQFRAQGLPPAKLNYNTDTFPPALIAASCVSPAMTVEQATEMWESDVWSQGELGRLFQAAWTVNQVVK
jgi:hypothetical protein